jgi:hypothetical protein
MRNNFILLNNGHMIPQDFLAPSGRSKISFHLVPYILNDSLKQDTIAHILCTSFPEATFMPASDRAV